MLIAGVLLLPSRRSREMHILAGNGWTHANAALQWSNCGTFGPGSNWIRTEYGRRSAWMVRDEAVGGTRVFARIDEFRLLLYLAGASAASAIAFILTRYATRTRTNVA